MIGPAELDIPENQAEADQAQTDALLDWMADGGTDD